MNVILALASLTAVVAAWYFHQQRLKQNQNVVYVIGDLHGDVECAKHWVQKTGLIRMNEWVDETSHLVFMGDYVDKGITSRQTVEYVKSLTDRFPAHVTALLGNHELELLRDRTEKVWGNGGYFQLPYASVHPAEYLGYLPTVTESDRISVDALYNASVEVYGRGLYRSVFFVPDIKQPSSILHLVPENLRSLVQDRLSAFQKAYLDTYRTGTVLGTWLEQRPIVTVIDGTFFVHGGLSAEAAPFVRTAADVRSLNEQFFQHATEMKLHKFLEQTATGQAIYNMLVYRGNHKEGACLWLSQVLPTGVDRLAVGHTPGSTVRLSQCINNQSILALDAALSRWFRNSGNDYCLGDHVRVSSNGQYTCDKKSDVCPGQIVRIVNGKVEVIK